MVPSTLRWVSNMRLDSSCEEAWKEAWKSLNSWYGIIEESWIPQGFGYAFGPPKGTDSFSSKQLLNMNVMGIYINESGKSSVMRCTTPNLDQPFQVYWNLEHLLGSREVRVKGLMSHALSVLVREVTRSELSPKVLASNKLPPVPERFADWNKLGRVTMMVDKTPPNLVQPFQVDWIGLVGNSFLKNRCPLKRERGEEDSKFTDKFLKPETKRSPKELGLTSSVLVSIPKRLHEETADRGSKRKRNYR